MIKILLYDLYIRFNNETQLHQLINQLSEQELDELIDNSYIFCDFVFKFKNFDITYNNNFLKALMSSRIDIFSFLKKTYASPLIYRFLKNNFDLYQSKFIYLLALRNLSKSDLKFISNLYKIFPILKQHEILNIEAIVTSYEIKNDYSFLKKHLNNLPISLQTKELLYENMLKYEAKRILK